MLYIDGEHLKSNEEIQAEFREFENPNLLKNEINFKVASIFSETVIVTDIYTSSCFLVISYRGFRLNYQEKLMPAVVFRIICSYYGLTLMTYTFYQEQLEWL